MRMTVRFDEIKVKAVRRWIDPITGKKRQETRTFSQTLNPFNKLPDGTVKDRATIYKEICVARDKWLKENGDRENTQA